ncbi:hypothetical protein [Butyrivibrio sp. WCE2006]|nr:hypothetical protein [Butyrivibrio sp. WCE2006]
MLALVIAVIIGGILGIISAMEELGFFGKRVEKKEKKDKRIDIHGP